MFGTPSFSMGSFGQQQPQQSGSIFGTTTSQPTFSGFGQPQQPTASAFGTSTFGQSQPSTTTGLLGTPAFGTGTLGQQQPTTGIFSGFGQTQPAQQSTSTFSGFGQPAAHQSTSVFNFGQTQPQQSTGAFTGFGQTQQQPATSTFSGFGQTQQQPASTFTGFGQTPAQPATSTFSGFGQTQPQQTSTFTGFGQTQPQQQTSTFTGFGQTQQQPATSTFSGFGQTQQQPASTFTGFGQTPAQPATNTFSGFGQPAQQPATSFSFSQPTTTTTAGAFNFSAGLGTTTSQPSTQIGVAQPFSFSTSKPATSSAPFSFSASGQPALGQQSTSLFQPLQTQQPTFSFQTQQQQQPFQFQQQMQQQAVQPLQVEEGHAFHSSIFQCNKFGDERDAILRKLNFLQAAWGRGRGHYSQTLPPVTYTTSNPIYHFKAVTYAFIQTDSNEDGYVTFQLKKSEEKARQEETNLITALQNMLGRPNILLKIVGMKRTDPNTTMVKLCAEDRNTLRRIPATDLTNGLLQPHLKAHLDSLLIENVQAKIRPSPEQLKRYLETAPPGFDSRVWKKAQEDNPDPEHMIPYAIVGIDALKKRAAFQESESHQHMTRLELMEEDIAALQNRHTNISAELQQLKRKQSELAHRLLKVILQQEVTRKDGTTIQPEEEELNRMLVPLEEQIKTPTEFRGKLNELLSRARLKVEEEGGSQFSLDEQTLSQIKAFLQTQQESIQSIANTLNDDMNQLRVTSESLNELELGMSDNRNYANNTFEA